MRRAYWFIFLGVFCFAMAAAAGPPSGPAQRQGPSFSSTLALPSADEAVPEQVAAVRETNQSGSALMAAGFERPLPEPMMVSFEAVELPLDTPAEFAGGILERHEDGALIWTARFSVKGAYAVGVHLKAVTLPEACRLSVFAPGLENPQSISVSSRSPEGEILSPYAMGPYGALQIEFPPSVKPSGGFEVVGISEILSPGRAGLEACPTSTLALPGEAAQVSAPQPLAIAPPSNLTATVTGATTIFLQWQDNATNETGYKVQRRLGTSGKYGLLVKLGPGSTNYTDGTVMQCQQYSYRVKAMKGTTASAPSNEVVITAGTPGTLTVTGTAGCSGNNPQNSLTWTASIAATSYDVSRNGAVYAAGQTGLAYVDTAVTPGQNYAYKITARNSCGLTDSNTIGVTTLSTCCPPPGSTTLSAVAGCSGSTPNVALSWTASTGATSYDVYRNGVVYAASQTGTTYTDTVVTAGTSYNYQVTAKNACGTAPSNTVTVTPASCCTAPGAFALAVGPYCYAVAPAVIPTTGILIAWTASSGVPSTTSYDVYKDGALFLTNANQTIVHWDPNGAGTTHFYTVRAKVACGAHTDSNTASAVAPANCSLYSLVDDSSPGYHTGIGNPALFHNYACPVAADCYNGEMNYYDTNAGAAWTNISGWWPTLLGGAGHYAVWVYVPGLFASDSHQAVYGFWHTSSTNLGYSSAIDQAAVHDLWIYIGTPSYFADGNDAVWLPDNTGELGKVVESDAIVTIKVP